MLVQQRDPSIPAAKASAPQPQFAKPQFPSPLFSSNIVFGEVSSQRESPVPQTQTIHDFVNQTLAQMTPLQVSLTVVEIFCNTLFERILCLCPCAESFYSLKAANA